MFKIRFVALFILIGLVVSTTGTAGTIPIMEAGKVSGVTEAFTTVNFNAPFSQSPVVFYLLGDANTTGSAVRIQNVGTSSFQIAQKEAPDSDGVTTADTIHWFAIEEGLYDLGGMTLLAGSVDTTKARGKNNNTNEFESIDLTAAGFANNPAVITSVNTFNNTGVSTDPPLPWIVSVAEDNSLSTTNVDIMLERAEVTGAGSGTISTAETLAYLAFDTGGPNTATGGSFSAASGTIDFAAMFSAANIDGEDNEAAGGQSIAFGTTFSDASEIIAVGEHNSINGADGGWLRRKSLSTTDIGVYLQEDTFQDTELVHGSNESAAVLAFSEAFHTVPEPSTLLLAVLGLLGLALLGRRRK